MRKFILACALLIATTYSQAQTPVNGCGTDEHLAGQLLNNAELQAAKAKFDAGLREFLKTYNPADYQTKPGAKKSGPKYIIPVVVHVFHNNSSENISDAQVISEIDFLNKSFRNLNSDTINRRKGWFKTSATDSNYFDFKSLAADAEIEFRLAKKDPNGNCTNGIVRVNTPLTSKGNDDLKKMSVWDTRHYFNMWVCRQINKGNSIGIAGYAQFPFGFGGGASTDGVIIIHNEFGNVGTSQAGQTPNVTTVTHETGHWLGLYHPFQIKTDSCGIDGDELFDTPPTYFSPTSSEPLRNRCNNSYFNSCSTEKPDVPDLQEDFMDYFIGNCASNMFTLQQKARMHYVLENFRREIWQPENLAATGVNGTTTTPCAPIAAFNTQTPITCAGNKITFYDYSYNASVTSWEWSFPGGSPATASTKSPSAIQYDTPGQYDVTLKVTGPNGTSTTTLKNYINIESAQTTVAQGYYTADWWYQNNWKEKGWHFEYENDKNQFERYGISYNQNASMRLTQDPFNQLSSVGSLFSLISPSFDFTGKSNAYFAFNYAFAQSTLSATIGGGNTKEILTTYVSTDCGKTWISRDTKSDGNISTIGATTLANTIDFVPADQSKWKEVLISGAKVPSTANVKFKIEFKYAGGSNFYLDNVRVGLINGISNVSFENQIKFSVQPNPFQTSTTVNYELNQNDVVKVKIIDIMGKEVATVFEGMQTNGSQSLTIDKNALQLTPGFYMINMEVGGNRLSHKILVE